MKRKPNKKTPNTPATIVYQPKSPQQNFSKTTYPFSPDSLISRLQNDDFSESDCFDNEKGHKIILKAVKPLRNYRSYHGEIYVQISSIKTETVGQNKVEVNMIVHVIDDMGNYITGLSSKNPQFHWCNLKDLSNQGSERITNYRVKEINLNDSHPYILDAVLDHSGSMSNDRVISLQKAFANYKNLHYNTNVIGAIKFDHQIFRECIPAKNVADDCFFINGYGMLGGGTALFDAIGQSLEVVKSFDIDSRHILVITDGYENSSRKFTSPHQITQYAKSGSSSVSIHIVGFGLFVDHELLASKIAQPTGGSFYRLCNSNEFEIIFNEIDKRIRNYYIVSYTTEKICGEHLAQLSLCKDKNRYSAENYYYLDCNTFDTVYFDFNSSKVKNKYKPKIKEVAEYLNYNRNANIVVAGHTDSIDSDMFNFRLSQKRAMAVYDVLLSYGADANQLTVEFYGENYPKSTNRSSKGRAKNRRVEFISNEKMKFLTPDESSLNFRIK